MSVLNKLHELGSLLGKANVLHDELRQQFGVAPVRDEVPQPEVKAEVKAAPVAAPAKPSKAKKVEAPAEAPAAAEGELTPGQIRARKAWATKNAKKAAAEADPLA